MPQITHPARLVLAVLLATVITLDAVLLDSFTFPIVLLAGLLCVVLVAGSFSTFAESRAFPAAFLVTQTIVAAFLAYQQNYVLAVILGVSILGTLQLLWKYSS